MEIRQAGKEDLEGIYSLFMRVNENLVSRGYNFWNHGYPNKESIFEGYDDGPMFIMEDEGKIIASVGLTFSFLEYYCYKTKSEEKIEAMKKRNGITEETLIVLERLMVDPSYQGKGLGRKMLEHLFVLYPDAAFPIAVFKEDDLGIGFYKRMGFIDCGTQPEFEWRHPESCTLMLYQPKK